MLLRAHKCGILLILAFCFFENISSSPQRKIKQNAASNATMHSAVNQTTTSTTKMFIRLTESYLPATMQALAYYIELLQYEPLHATTVEPPFTLSTTPLTLPNYPSVSSPRPPVQQPVTWWSPPSTTTSKPPVTWWSPPSTTTTRKPVIWWNPSTSQSDTSEHGPEPVSTTTKAPTTMSTPTTTTRPTTTYRPSISTTTPSWWHQETTPFHKPGNFAPEQQSTSAPSGAHQITSKPNTNPKPQFGDLSYLSIASFPYFEYYVPLKTKTFAKNPEHEWLNLYPAELLQEIENEPYEQLKGTDQEIANEFRRKYDDFFTRVRIFAPVTGKKRVPPTRPYVLFLIFYDLCKREAKRLTLQEFTGYSNEMMARLHETSKYSAERQLYTLMHELMAQNSIVANDFKTRIEEIMADLVNPNSVTAKALHILPPLKFEI